MPSQATHYCAHCRSPLTNFYSSTYCNGEYYCEACSAVGLHRCTRCNELTARIDVNGRCINCSGYSERRTRPEEATWNPMPVACDSGQCFGIELETSRCHGYKALRGHTCFGAKYDSSVSGMEFISPILSGDTGLDEVKAFCNKAKELNFAVDGDCGFHLHLDMRSMSNEQRRHIAYAYRITYTIWMRLVNSYRAHDCSYCRAPRYAPSDILDAVHFDDFCYECSRYEFVNLSAYSSHRTLEIRGYQGTLNPVEIINWIEAHLRFVEYVKDKPFEELARLDWAAFKKIIGPDLARYYGRKRAGSIPAERPWQATRQCADFDLTSSN